MATAVLPSYFVPAIAGAGMWMFAAYTFDLKQKLNVPVSQDPTNLDREPFQAPIGHIHNWYNVDTRGRFRSVQQEIDHLGADIFLVDYGNGQRVIQYHDPRLLL